MQNFYYNYISKMVTIHLKFLSINVIYVKLQDFTNKKISFLLFHLIIVFKFLTENKC